MVGLFIFILGLIFGSFFNVVALRGVEGESLIGRSACPSCGSILKPWNLIPVFSYLFQKGKCSHCGEPISLIYPSIELMTGLGWLLTYITFGINELFFIMIVINSALIISTLTDVKEMIVLDSVVLIAGILLIGLEIYFFGSKVAISNFGYAAVWFFALWILVMIGAMGGGDVKLFALIAFAIGSYNTLIVITIASISAMIITLFKKKVESNMIRFVPYIYIGVMIFQLSLLII